MKMRGVVPHEETIVAKYGIRIFRKRKNLKMSRRFKKILLDFGRLDSDISIQ